MRRAFSILLGIFLGALASAIGIGIVLLRANADRVYLSTQLTNANTKVQTTLATNGQAIEEANKKLQAANAEITKAQTIIKELEQERDLLARATPLRTPSPAATRGWINVVSIPLGISLKVPPGNIVLKNDTATLVIGNNPQKSAITPWLAISTYSELDEKTVSALFKTSTPVAYIVNGRPIEGALGTLADGKPLILLHIRSGEAKHHLLWIRPSTGDEKILQTILATLSIQE